jgi:hypothetical protein
VGKLRGTSEAVRFVDDQSNVAVLRWNPEGIDESAVDFVDDRDLLRLVAISSGSSGTPEAVAVARGYRSKYQATKREETATRLLDQMVGTAILL